MKKFLRIATVLAGAAAALAVIFFGSGYLWSLRDRNAEPVLPETAVLTPDEAVAPGEDCRAAVEFELPVCRRLVRAEMEPPPGMVAAGPVEVTERRGWSRRTYRCQAVLRAVAPAGDREGGGRLALELSPPSGTDENPVLSVPVPSVRVEYPERIAESELALAGAVTSEQTRSISPWWWLTALVLIPVGWLVWRKFRSGAAAPPIPVWEAALNALAELRRELAGRRVSPEYGFARLTDLVRGYLEQRFKLPATTRTTPEFLADLDRGTGGFPAAERPALKRFMMAADLVKFARATPDPALLEQAIDSAEHLVRSTVVRPDEAENPELNGGLK